MIFHSLCHAKAALYAAQRVPTEVVLCTARGAIRYAGASYLIDIVRLAIGETGSVANLEAAALIDCRDEPVFAFAALRAGWRSVLYNGPKHYRNEVAAAAKSYGAVVIPRAPRSLDLMDRPDPAATCLKWYVR